MDRLTWFGLFAVTAMLVCYALEKRSRWFVLGFAASCALGSATGFFKVRGLSDWWRLFGRSLRSDDGGSLRIEAIEPLRPSISVVAYTMPLDNDSQW